MRHDRHPPRLAAPLAPTVAPVAGGVYRDRKGRRHGPMHADDAGWIVRRNDGMAWRPDGRFRNDHGPSTHDLVERLP